MRQHIFLYYRVFCNILDIFCYCLIVLISGNEEEEKIHILWIDNEEMKKKHMSVAKSVNLRFEGEERGGFGKKEKKSKGKKYMIVRGEDFGVHFSS
jgi:hypothetical protein